MLRPFVSVPPRETHSIQDLIHHNLSKYFGV